MPQLWHQFLPKCNGYLEAMAVRGWNNEALTHMAFVYNHDTQVPFRFQQLSYRAFSMPSSELYLHDARRTTISVKRTRINGCVRNGFRSGEVSVAGCMGQ